MKQKFLLSVIAMICLAFSSCKTQQFGYVATYLDYTPYSEQGFFLTELNSVPFDYTPIGSMTVTEYSGKDTTYTPERTNSSFLMDDIYARIERTKVSKDWRFASAETAIAEIVARSKKAGGDGLVALTITTIVDPKSNLIVSVTVSGMIIKRK